MRSSLFLTLSALGAIAAIAAGVSFLLVPGLGLEAMFAHHARHGWPVEARALLALGGVLALAAAAFRWQREGWRAGLFGGLAWAALGLMVASWSAMTPAAPPPPAWSTSGLGAAAILALCAQPLLGWRGASSAVRDMMLGGVAGAATAWTVAAFLQ